MQCLSDTWWAAISSAALTHIVAIMFESKDGMTLFSDKSCCQYAKDMIQGQVFLFLDPYVHSLMHHIFWYLSWNCCQAKKGLFKSDICLKLLAAHFNIVQGMRRSVTVEMDICMAKSWTRQPHTQGFGRTSPDITKVALNAPGQLWTIYGHREHMLAHRLTGVVHTYIYRTIWLHPYGQSMDYYSTWGQLLYDWTVLEWHVYLQSLWSLSYMHTPSFYTYTYTFLRFRACIKS